MGTNRQRPQVTGEVLEVDASLVVPEEGEEERDLGPGGLRRSGEKGDRRTRSLPEIGGCQGHWVEGTFEKLVG